MEIYVSVRFTFSKNKVEQDKKLVKAKLMQKMLILFLSLKLIVLT